MSDTPIYDDVRLKLILRNGILAERDTIPTLHSFNLEVGEWENICNGISYTLLTSVLTGLEYVRQMVPERDLESYVEGVLDTTRNLRSMVIDQVA